MRVPHTRSVRGKGSELLHRPCGRKAECRGDLVLPHPSPGPAGFAGRVVFWQGVKVTPSAAGPVRRAGGANPSVEAPEPIAAGPPQVACLRVLRVGYPLPPLPPHQGRSST